jgi:VanZ family protein
LGFGLALLIIIFTLGPVGLRPQTGHPDVERFLAFVAVAAVFTLALPRRLAWVLIGVVLMAISLEVGQLLIPGRDARVTDAVVKVLGGVIGVAAGGAYRAFRSNWKIQLAQAADASK